MAAAAAVAIYPPTAIKIDARAIVKFLSRYICNVQRIRRYIHTHTHVETERAVQRKNPGYSSGTLLHFCVPRELEAFGLFARGARTHREDEAVELQRVGPWWFR